MVGGVMPPKPLTTHAVLGFSQPVVKEDQIFLPVRVVGGMEAVSAPVWLWRDLIATVQTVCDSHQAQPAPQPASAPASPNPFKAAWHDLRQEDGLTIPAAAARHGLTDGSLCVWLSRHHNDAFVRLQNGQRPCAGKRGPKPGSLPSRRDTSLDPIYMDVLHDWERGEGTQRQLCKVHGVHVGQFTRWLQWHREQQRAAAERAPVLKPGGKIL